MKLWVKIALWIIFAGSVITLLVMVERFSEEQTARQPEINIVMEGGHPFLNDSLVLHKLKLAGLIYDDQQKKDLDLAKIEAYIRSISQVKDVEVYEEFGGSWTIDISLRKPIARIFNLSGETYYLDDEGTKMSITPVHTAHVLVFSGYVRDRKAGENVADIINNDSLISIRKLDDIYRISNYVCKDTLFRSLIGQVYLKRNGDFVLLPIVGEQEIIFGSANTEKEVAAKFEKLRIFYQDGMPYEGWDKYSEISLKYKDQIVCRKVE